VIQSSSFCELLGKTIASWNSDSIAEPAELQPLTSLTRLTRLCVMDGTNLGDMTELRHLQHFNSLSLHKVYALASKMPNFNNLQSLSLSGCWDETWDFSSCSSLTHLRLSSLGDNVKQIMLPSDPQVMLQELLVGMRVSRDTHDYVMANIGKATQLTEVKFMFAYPSNFRDGEWPLHLPNLRNLQLTGLSCDLPSAMTSCPNLQRFTVTDHEQGTLPLWLSSMTQLTYLRIGSGRLEQFPEHILQLSQLGRLLMSNTPDFVLPRSLSQCAYWPNLTSLHIDVREASVSLESQLILLQLETLIKPYNSGCDIRFH